MDGGDTIRGGSTMSNRVQNTDTRFVNAAAEAG
jgi:hypothetical protein